METMHARTLLILVALAAVAPLSAHQRAAAGAHHPAGCPFARVKAAAAEAAGDALPAGASLLDRSASAALQP